MNDRSSQKQDIYRPRIRERLFDQPSIHSDILVAGIGTLSDLDRAGSDLRTAFKDGEALDVPGWAVLRNKIFSD